MFLTPAKRRDIKRKKRRRRHFFVSVNARLGDDPSLFASLSPLSCFLARAKALPDRFPNYSLSLFLMCTFFSSLFFLLASSFIRVWARERALMPYIPPLQQRKKNIERQEIYIISINWQIASSTSQPQVGQYNSLRNANPTCLDNIQNSRKTII